MRAVRWVPRRRSAPSMLRAGFSRLRLVASALRDLLDLLLRQGLHAGEARFPPPLARVVGEDELLRARAVDDVGHPIVEVRRSAPGDRDAREAHAATAFHLRERLAASVHCALYLATLRRSGGTEERVEPSLRTLPAKLTSGAISVSRSPLSARNARARRCDGTRTACNRENFVVCPPWTNGPAQFASLPARPRQGV